MLYHGAMKNGSGAVRTRRGSTRTTGLVIAVVMGLASAAVIGYFVVFGKSGRQTGAALLPGELPPDIRAVPKGVAGASGAAVQGGRGLSAQFASKSDPTRMAGRINSESLDPLEGKRYHATKPESFVYMKDGRTVHIRSDSGRLYMPQGSAAQPDSGTLNGNVVIGLYEVRADGKEIKPGTDAPALTLTTGSLTFDLTAGEVTIPERFVIQGEVADFAGTGLVLQLNQTQERAEYVRIAKSEPLRLRPGAGKKSEAKKPVAASAGGKGAAAGKTAGGPPSEPKPAPPETFYHTVLQGGVTVTRSGQRIASEALELWTHLVDNQLPPNAIASGGTGTKAPARDAAPSGEAKPVAKTDAGAVTGSPSAVAQVVEKRETDEVVITWAGPLEMRPVEQRPQPLAKDDVAVKFTSPVSGKVEFSEESSGAGGYASAVEYGATSRNLTLAGDGPGTVRLRSPEAGEAIVGNVRINLGTGITHIEGAGELQALASGDKDGGKDRSIRWGEQADFQFVTENGEMSDVLKTATISGAVSATDGKASLKGDFLNAEFSRAGSSSVLKRLVVQDGVVADDGKESSIACSHLDVAFAARDGKPEQSDPSRVTARGNVLAKRSDSRLRAGLVDADLVRDEKGDTVVKEVMARDEVRFDRTDGVWARAEELHADALQQIVDLTGEDSAVGKETTSVNARQIRLDGGEQTMTVFGAGTFEHEEIKDGMKTGGTATARWTKEMVFSDKSGVLDCRGDIEAVLTPDELSKRVLKSERLRLELTPGDKAVSLAGEGAPIEGADRRVLRAIATGGENEDENGAPASVESTRYQARAPGQTGRLIAESLHIEGHRILADDVEGTVTVPEKGRLIVVDKRTQDEDKNDAAKSAIGQDLGAKGTAVFYWQGDFRLDRRAGTATMRRQVQLLHKSLKDDVSRLESEELTAYFRELSPANAAEGDVQAQLLRVVASGAVWAKNAGKEMIADRAEYDAISRVLKAFASANNDVTLYDPAQTTPITAQELTWDLAKDRIVVDRPGTMVVPK